MTFTSRRGTVADIVLSPTFVTILVLGFVFFRILGLVMDIGTSTAYDKHFYATDIGLLVDSLQAVYPDISLNVEYALPIAFAAKIAKGETSVSLPREEAAVFYYLEDPRYTSLDVTLVDKSPYQFQKRGFSLFVGEEPLYATPVCPNLEQTLAATIDSRALAELDSGVQLVSGDATIFAHTTDTSNAIIYTNTNPTSATVACTILQLISRHPDVLGFAVVPLNPALLDDSDPRKKTALDPGVSLYVESPRIDPFALSRAITEALRVH